MATGLEGGKNAVFSIYDTDTLPGKPQKLADAYQATFNGSIGGMR